jgi:F-type H+-transporting ATPase subunit gamma
LEAREEITAVSILLLSSDRGLCGAFNFNIVRRTLQFIQSLDLPTTLVTVGRKGRDLMYRAGQSISADFSDFPVDPSILDVTPIAHALRSDFRERRADIVYLAYMDFVNTLVQRPVVRRLLPLRPPSIEDQAVAEFIAEAPVVSDEPLEYIYEPSATAILDEVLPRFTELQIYQALLESQASEHSARMVAMRNASENAEVLVQDLTLARNKARQSAITGELLDIAGGAEALARASAAGRQ